MSQIIIINVDSIIEKHLKKEFPTRINQSFTSTTLYKLLFVGFISNSDSEFEEILKFIIKKDYPRRTIYMKGDTIVIMKKNIFSNKLL